MKTAYDHATKEYITMSHRCTEPENVETGVAMATEMWTSPYTPKEDKPAISMQKIAWINSMSRDFNTGQAHSRCHHCHKSYTARFMKLVRQTNNWFAGKVWVCNLCSREHRNLYQEDGR